MDRPTWPLLSSVPTEINSVFYSAHPQCIITVQNFYSCSAGIHLSMLPERMHNAHTMHIAECGRMSRFHHSLTFLFLLFFVPVAECGGVCVWGEHPVCWRSAVCLLPVREGGKDHAEASCSVLSCRSCSEGDLEDGTCCLLADWWNRWYWVNDGWGRPSEWTRAFICS